MGRYVDYWMSHHRLDNLTYKIIQNSFGWLPQKDYDDFYSIATTTLWYCEEHYDSNRNKTFYNYLVDSLHRKFKTRLTHINRKKRGGGVAEISLDKFIDESDDMTLGEMLVVEETSDIDPLTQRYLDSLTKRQGQIAALIMKGYDKRDIVNMLSISCEQYDVALINMSKEQKITPLKTLKERMRQNADDK